MFPSKKAVRRMCEAVREQTAAARCWVPLPELIEVLNQQLRGWANYFRIGYPAMAYREIDTYTRCRLTIHVRRRSQRPFQPPRGVTYYQQFQRMGLVRLGGGATAQLPASAQRRQQ